MSDVPPVLIVEDDQDSREALTDALASAGIAVASAGTAEEALAYLRDGTSRPCLLLIDLLMPGMTGWELLAEIGREPRLAAIPVVVMSGLQEPGSPPGVPVVRKPVQLKVLLATVRDYCSRLSEIR